MSARQLNQPVAQSKCCPARHATSFVSEFQSPFCIQHSVVVTGPQSGKGQDRREVRFDNLYANSVLL